MISTNRNVCKILIIMFALLAIAYCSDPRACGGYKPVNDDVIDCEGCK